MPSKTGLHFISMAKCFSPENAQFGVGHTCLGLLIFLSCFTTELQRLTTENELTLAKFTAKTFTFTANSFLPWPPWVN
jgi:hypothetical protein